MGDSSAPRTAISAGHRRATEACITPSASSVRATQHSPREPSGIECGQLYGRGLTPALWKHKPTNIAEVLNWGSRSGGMARRMPQHARNALVIPNAGITLSPATGPCCLGGLVEHSPIETKTHPLHVKKVRLIDIEKVKQLPCTQPGTQPFFEKAPRWLTNGDLYPTALLATKDSAHYAHRCPD
jgi:hypothetical protein